VAGAGRWLMLGEDFGDVILHRVRFTLGLVLEIEARIGRELADLNGFFDRKNPRLFRLFPS
jgi:hypothetical protein